MNDDFTGEAEAPKSRWTVAPGSVSGSFRNRATSPDAENSPAARSDQPHRRTADEILAEARRTPTLPPTTSGGRHRAADDADEFDEQTAQAPRAQSPTRNAPREIDVRPERAARDFDVRTERAVRDFDEDEDEDEPPTRITANRQAVPAPLSTTATPQRPPVLDDDGLPRPAARERLLNAPEQGDRKDLRAPDGVGHAPVAILAGFGGVLLITFTAAIGGLIDFLISGTIGLFGAIGLCLGTAFAALVTRKRDLLTILVAAPIIYAAIGVLVLLASSKPISAPGLADLAITGFPAMSIATGIATIVIGIKLLTTRVGERR